MLNRIKRSLAVGFMVAMVPTALAAQQPGAALPQQLPPEVQAVITEIQQLQARLQPIQMRALQDESLITAQEAFGAHIEAAMIRLEPATADRLARLEALVAEAQVADANQDQARFSEIIDEGQQLEAQLRATQQRALETADVAVEFEQLQTAVQRKIIEVDPAAEELLERLEELDTRLAMLLGQGR